MQKNKAGDLIDLVICLSLKTSISFLSYCGQKIRRSGKSGKSALS